ncbi:UbiE/COQ5 family methyltransferase [Aspergillus costaricaensis CBS 115574]|uniref:UbiE/COQ5 family methyltransferase n=1 Tax=Aspergillus costaricaensis CBS 115574 TaxID=1448317 RepID=A0ACD1IE16_9EURO|nr:UbiE/COQ5 family methyltransferase [Aspergillus costaricaensis CBS 115574]RAK88252.1 UbiE/COQ5 family methyltransferase [Aspergillus costaricaensis CBS 115574]
MTRTPTAPEKHNHASASRYMSGSRISNLFAEELVEKSGIAWFGGKPLAVFDDACGTGAVSSALHRRLSDEITCNWQLTCGDISEAMVEVSKQKMVEEGWRNAEVRVVDAHKTELPSEHYTHVLSGFAFNLFPNDQAAMEECFRILQRGGILAVSTWSTTVWMTLIQAAIASLPSDLPTPTTDDIFGLYNENWTDETRVRALFEQAGFTDINVTTVAKQYSVPVQELAEACKISLPHITRKFWTQEQRDRYEAEVPKAALRILEENMGKDGVGAMKAEAIIATARKP